jgi:hypothetical protein
MALILFELIITSTQAKLKQLSTIKPVTNHVSAKLHVGDLICNIFGATPLTNAHSIG